ncbi:hypothetical protein [Bacteroides sp. An51A]|uniref:hypothetical protein n=1 Tax=Bacteroides sp. An51A TaxID=1965640 RepID=UPI000B3982C4|nr:hypothetical protein [Bacteroides sp. An51A]OUN80438.1 hypothetical protein B5G04_08580 [Bacteroides sp. An51A]
MKEMENNDFIHTLDAVYNLCSEIKELVNVETEKQEDEGSEGIILLSDNLQRLQSEITEMKTGLSYDREERERLRTAINLQLKEVKEVYSVLSTTNGKIFAEQERISNELQRLQNLKVQNNHTHVIDFKTSRPFLWQVVMSMIILFLLVGNAYQFKQNLNLSDNDLKYRLIKMYGGISGNQLDTLEEVFHRDRDKTVIRNIRNEVEDFEYRIRVRTEKLERARLLQQEAERLK